MSIQDPGSRPTQWGTLGDHQRRIQKLEAIDPCNCGDNIPSCSEAVATISLSNTLTAYWRLNEGAAPYADSSGFDVGDPADMARTALAVPMTQAFTPAATPEDATAVAFNADGTGGGNGDYLSASGLADATRFAFPGTTPFTVAAWVNPFIGAASSLGGVVDHFHLTSWSPPTGFTDGWMLGVNQPAQTPYFQRLPFTPYGGTPPTATGAAISPGVWHLIVGIYDGSELHVYVDNVLSDTVADSGSLGTGLLSNPPQIGIGQDTTATGKWFYGGVAEVSVWDAALTFEEITLLFECATGTETVGPIDSTENAGTNWGVHSAGPEDADTVLSADGGGGSQWAFPTVAVDDPAGRYDTINLGTGLTGTDEGDGSITINSSGGGGTPSGPAGGDLAGTYPDPTLAVIGSAAGPIGSTSVIPVVTIDTKGRVTALTSASPQIDTVGAGTDIATNNVSTSKHGLAPKLPNDATKFLNGVGAYAVPPSGATPDDTYVWMPLTSTVGGDDVLVFDADHSLIPTLIPF